MNIKDTKLSVSSGNFTKLEIIYIFWQGRPVNCESLLFNSPGHSKSIALLYPFAYFCCFERGTRMRTTTSRILIKIPIQSSSLTEFYFAENADVFMRILPDSPKQKDVGHVFS